MGPSIQGIRYGIGYSHAHSRQRIRSKGLRIRSKDTKTGDLGIQDPEIDQIERSGPPKSGPRTPKMTHFGRSRSVPDRNTEDARTRTDGGYRKGPPREHIRYTSRMGCGPGAIRDTRIEVPWVGTHEGSNLEVQIPRIQGLGYPNWRSWRPGCRELGHRPVRADGA